MQIFDERGRFGGFLLAADVDGTLLTDDKRILDIDRAAISEFRAGGGLFTIATGRGISYARPVAEDLGLSIPAVIFNGAAVYDFVQDRYLWRCFLPDTIMAHLLPFMERFPGLGVEVLRESEIYTVSTNFREEEHLRLGGVTSIRCSLGDVPPDEWTKVLFADEADVIDEVALFAESLGIIDLHMVRSAPVYFEVLPHGVNKGNALMRLVELIGAGDRRIVAIGDYMNDLDMIKMADIKAAVANAQDIIKSNAELLVCDNNNGAVHELIQWLKQMEQ